MTTQFPLRSRTHQLEELSERHIRSFLPENWVCEKSRHDYGVDLHIDIFENDAATGLELLVQLKASERPIEGDTEVVRLKTSTYNYLLSKLQVVMLIKYVKATNEAYWLLLRDIHAPSVSQKTFTVRIPKTNQLSTLDWHVIQGFVSHVANTKLTFMRREELARRDGGNRIVACNRYYKLIYIFSIFKIPANIPSNSLALIGCYWITKDTNIHFWHSRHLANQCLK